MNSYDLSRNWFNFCFENPEKIKPNHSAVYFFAIEHCNRLGWKDKFGLPTTMTMEAIGIKSYNTYINAFNDLVDFGFFKCIERSKNQYSSNIIKLSNFNKALDKALDKAFIKHDVKQSESTEQSIDSINKQTNKKQQTTNKNSIFDFKKSLIDLNIDENIISEWLAVRKRKKATNSETAFKKIISEIEKSKLKPNEAIKISVENSWSGFNHKWCDNLIKNESLNNKNSKNNLDNR